MEYENYYTYQEIKRQPKTWQRIFDSIVIKKDYDSKIFEKKYDEIILFGCGSSYNLSQSGSFFTKSLLNNSANAIPSSEILINPYIFINKQKKYLFIGFSRSGETTESVEVIKILKNLKNVTIFTFTCNASSSFSKLSSFSFTCSDSLEKSIVMTESFSSMLIAYCLIISTLIKDRKLLESFRYLIEYLDEKMPYITEFAERYIDQNKFKSYFALGSGFNYGLSVEADLKMKEMSQIPSYSYHLYEFNHGPKSLLNNESLCLILTIDEKMKKHKELLKEFNSLGAHILIVSDKKINNIGRERIEYFLIEKSFCNNMVKSFINIPVFQNLAFFKTIKNNLNPDLPANLSYSVKI